MPLITDVSCLSKRFRLDKSEAPAEFARARFSIIAFKAAFTAFGGTQESVTLDS
jgi:hypothetical protein